MSPIIVQNGITAGSPFGLNSLVKITNVGPPAELSAIAAQGLTDAVSLIDYVSVANAAGVYNTITNAQETFRIQGGMIVSGTGTDSVQIGKGADASATDAIAIGRAAIADITQTVVIGAMATNTVGGGQQGVIVGHAGSMNNAAGVVIGHAAAIVGNAGGALAIAIGNSASATCGTAGGGTSIAIGNNAVAMDTCVVIGGAASSNINSASGVGSVVIGHAANSNKAIGFNVVIGYTASVTQTNAIGIGSGVAVTAAAAQTYSIAIGAGTTITSTQSITIGGGGVDLGANVLQLGAVNTPILSLIFGAGDTIATPGAKSWRFTNASGADNPAGNFTHTAPLSSGNATPASYIIQVGVQVAGSSSTLQTAGNAVVFSHTTAGGHLATFSNRVSITNAVANTTVVSVTGGSLTGSDASTFWSYAGTWNTSGTPTALSASIINTASNANSLLINLLAGAGGATSMFRVLALSGSVVMAGSLTMSQTGSLNFGSFGGVTAAANGVLNLIDTAGTSFTRLNLGLATTSFPAFTRNGINVIISGGTGTAVANLGIGDAAPGTGFVNGLYFGTTQGTSPSTTVDLVHLYGLDISAGNRALAIWQEAAPNAAVAVVSTHGMLCTINGTQYRVLLTTVLA